MAKRVVDESSLTSVADAIRERAGTSEPLVFPEGFKSAVEGIPDNFSLYLTEQITHVTDEKCNGKKTYLLASCNNLVYVNFPNATGVGYAAFASSTNLKTVIMPKITFIDSMGFRSTGIETVDFPLLQSIGPEAFALTRSLKALILRNTKKVCSLLNKSAFSGSGVSSGTGYIYVPKTMADGSDGVEAYKSASNWSNYSSQIRAIEDYPEITGGAV